MDWLRIGAFGVLIVYHIGMVFVPWGWHVKTQDPIEWLVYPMLAVNPWRLSLLFLVSGFASRAMLSKADASLSQFLSQRASRLLIPLVFGIVFIIPPQSWAELSSSGAIESGFFSFWLGEYFTFGLIAGVVVPTYNHLWFILYLFLYTAALGAALALVPLSGRAASQSLFDRGLGSPACWIAAPVLALFMIWVALFPEGGLRPPIVIGDWYRHAVYFVMFAIGFGLARSEPVWNAIRASWQWAFGLAAIGYICTMLARDGVVTMAPALSALAVSVQSWGMIAGLIGLADRFWNRDAPWRHYLAVGVFPFYIIHQTIIVLMAFALIEAGAGAAVQLTAIFFATVLGCWIFYELARRSGPFKLLFGLR